MKNNILIAVLVILIAGISSVAIVQDKESEVIENGIMAMVYKSPSCGCCGVYASYMDKQGYQVERHNIEDMSEVKDRFGIPYELESCHTMEVGGYVVEGHVPNEAIEKLLGEKPDIKGIGMPGMPSGSPGMPGPKNGEFVIHEITHEGTIGNVFLTI